MVGTIDFEPLFDCHSLLSKLRDHSYQMYKIKMVVRKAGRVESFILQTVTSNDALNAFSHHLLFRGVIVAVAAVEVVRGAIALDLEAADRVEVVDLEACHVEDVPDLAHSLCEGAGEELG